ncbi:hypothetical protein [Caulobacter sp. BE254]|uniref:hypothetical protein n=1 Tax=Caulobacter sp. BE254 TaxID=2817720 RepID=UPI0028668C30|nr:hypothetical protein [Caulobacter sp. BE254]MDR7117205.1 hypothetical protein [Caulobacter sp. BE254]
MVRWSDKPDRFLLTNHHVLTAPEMEGDNVSIYEGEKGSCSKPGANAVLDDAHRFDGRVFSLKGASGSLVVDNQGKSVGRLDAGGMKAFDTVGQGFVDLPIGITVAQFIVPALAHPSYAAF